jgi:predicted anti-sigma-YlaC factor YlaD
LHLDDCAACRARVAALDPWTAHFRAVAEPMVPDDLIDAVIAASHDEDPAVAWGRLAAGVALMLLGAITGLYATATGADLPGMVWAVRAFAVVLGQIPWVSAVGVVLFGTALCLPLITRQPALVRG